MTDTTLGQTAAARSASGVPAVMRMWIVASATGNLSFGSRPHDGLAPRFVARPTRGEPLVSSIVHRRCKSGVQRRDLLGVDAQATLEAGQPSEACGALAVLWSVARTTRRGLPPRTDRR